jgi:hypothetical protein
MRSEASEGRSLLAPHLAEFWQGGDEGGSGGLGDALDGGGNSDLPLQGAAVRERADRLIKRLDLALDDGQHGLVAGGEFLAVRSLGSVLLGHLDGDEVVAAAHQFLEPCLARFRGTPQGKSCPSLETIGGEFARIDGVALAELAARADGGLDLARVGAMDLKPTPKALIEQDVLITVTGRSGPGLGFSGRGFGIAGRILFVDFGELAQVLNSEFG